MIGELNKLGIALKSLETIKIGTVGVNTGNLDTYRTAIKGLSIEQSVFALASKGATEEQIRQILVTDASKVSDVEAAIAKAGLTTSTKALTQAEMVELATKTGVAKAEAETLLSKIGVIATEKGQIAVKHQVTLAMLEQAVANGTLTTAESSQIAIMLGLNAVETTNIGITNLLTASFAKLWAVITAHPIGAILTAIGAVAVGTIAYINKVNKDAEKAIKEAHENAETALNDTKTSLSDTKSNLQSVNSELETTKSSLKELITIGYPTLAEQNEINKLSIANDQLETQKSLLENNLKLKQKAAALDARELLGTQVEMSYSDIQDWTEIVSHNEEYTYSEHAKYEASNLKNAYNIYMKALKDGNAKKQKLAQDLIDSSSGDSAELTSAIMEIANSFKYDDGAIIEGYEDLYNEYMGYIYNLQSLTNPDTFLDIAKSVTSGTDIDYEKAISDAYAMIYNGNFDIDSLNEDFINKMAESGVDKSTIDYIFTKKQQEYQLVLDKINTKYNSNNVQSTYWDYNGNIHHNTEEEKKQKVDIEKVNAELNDYAKNNPIEFSLITSYDENFTLLDKYIEEEKNKAENNADYVGDYVSNAIKRIYTQAIEDAKNAASDYSPSDIFSLNDTDLGKLNSQVDQIQQAYQTLYDIQEGYSENKSIDVDQLQSLLSLGDDFLDYLVDEDGNLKMDTKSMQDLTAARLLEMKAKVQQGIIDNATNINDEASANDYLKSTNYALADSIQEVNKAKLDEWKTEALAKGEISTPTIDSVYNKAVADLQKTEDLFNNIDLSPTSFGASSTSAFSKQIDFLKTRLTELDELTNKVSASMDNMVGSASKNNLVDAMFAIDGNRKETLEKGIKLYQDEASKALAKIPAEYRDMAINGSITLGTFEGKGNEDVVQAIEDYRTWSEKVASTTEEIEKLTTAMRQLQVDKFNNIADDYSALTDLISSNTTLLESQISLLETKGQKVGKSYYTSLIEQNSTYIDILKQERESLNNQMSSAMANGVKYASEEWQDMYTKIQDVDNSIIEATNSVQEYTNALRDVDISVFNDITSAISGIKDELSNIIGVLNTEDNVLGDFGGFSADAITSIALYKQQMEASQYEIARTQKEIAKLNDEYANGEWGIDDYTERLQELEEQSWSNVDAYESAKDAILELAKSRVDEEIEAIEESTSAYEDYISKLKDALDAEKKLHDYKKSIEEKQSELTDIQNQINSRLGSDDAATLAEIEKLQSEYAKKVSEIQDLQYDKSIEDQQDALDKQLEDYKKTQENKKTELEKSLEDTEEIITKTIESVLSNASTVSSKLAEVTKKYGINISKNITDPWKSGNNAISGYQTQLTTSTSVFNTKLDGVSNHIRNLQVTADTMAYQMTKDFNSVSGETLNSTLSRVQSYLAYCSTSSVYLKDQIYNTLNQSYSSKGIVDTFTNVKNSIDSATNSLRNYIDLTRQKNQQKYKLVQIVNGINGTQRTTVVRTGVTEAEAYANNISFRPTSQQGATWYKLVAMAKGGVVKKDNEPSTVARSLGEDTLVAAKYGEGVFTKEQTNALLDLAPTLPDFAKYLPTFDISKFVNNVPRINSMPIVNINYDNLISIDGGTITKDSIPDLQELTKNVANNVSQQLAKDLKNNKGWTTNACRPY